MEKELVRMSLNDLIPYERNPRKNDQAVDAVAQSIVQCGYVSPIIVDEDNIVLAGHTRLKALQFLRWKECDVMIVRGLTEEQKKKFRLLDNKTSEFAEWDFELLDWELQGLDFEGFDFGFDFEPEEKPKTEKEISTLENSWQIVVDCESESDMEEKYNTLMEMGIECRVSTL